MKGARSTEVPDMTAVESKIEKKWDPSVLRV